MTIKGLQHQALPKTLRLYHKNKNQTTAVGNCRELFKRGDERKQNKSIRFYAYQQG